MFILRQLCFLYVFLFCFVSFCLACFFGGRAGGIMLFWSSYHYYSLHILTWRNIPYIMSPALFLSMSFSQSLSLSIYIYIYHHHHIVLAARISLTLSRHSSLSFIALGRSSGQQPVSLHSC